MKLVVLRPTIGGEATAGRASRAGYDAVVAPLFQYRRLSWSPPDPAAFDALLLTSAAAVRLGGQALVRFAALPVQAVGSATAEAARTAGFAKVTTDGRNAVAAVARLAEQGHRRIFHPVGLDHIAIDHPMLSIHRVPVYVADAVRAFPDAARHALTKGAVALLHSPRAAHVFATLLGGSDVPRATVRIACFSPAVADAAGPGWAAVGIAAMPTDDALFAAARLLCDQGGNGTWEPR